MLEAKQKGWVVYRDNLGMGLTVCRQYDWDEWEKSIERVPNSIAKRFELVADRLTYKQARQMVELTKE